MKRNKKVALDNLSSHILYTNVKNSSEIKDTVKRFLHVRNSNTYYSNTLSHINQKRVDLSSCGSYVSVTRLNIRVKAVFFRMKNS